MAEASRTPPRPLGKASAASKDGLPGPVGTPGLGGAAGATAGGAWLNEVQLALAGELLRDVGRSRYRLWFRDVDVAGMDGDTLTLAVPTEVHRSWIEYTFAQVVREASERVLGHGVKVDLQVGEAQGVKRALRERLPQRPDEWEKRLSAERPAPTFASFEAAGQDRWAVTLLEQLVHGAGPGAGAPLYLYGEPGSGKTHLLRALEAAVNALLPGDCLYLKGRRFRERVAEATRPGTSMTALKAFETDLGARRLVLIDGVDALEGRSSSEAELARLLDRAPLGGPRLVLAGPTHPRAMEDMEPALASRLAGGPVLRLATPDRALLADILRRRHAAKGLEAPTDVVATLLDGTCSPHAAVLWLDRWAVASRALGRPLEAGWLAEVAPPASTSVGEDVVRRTKAVVAGHFGVDAGLLERATKARSAALPRAAAVYLVWRATAMPLTRLAHAFGFRSHSSVSRALSSIQERRRSDAELEHTLDGLLARL